jgi:hypothetical protein
VCELGGVEALVTLIVAVVVGGVLIWLTFRLEPHWSRRDGTRFTCRVQLLRHDLAAEGIWRDMRATASADAVHLSSRGLRGAGVRGSYRVVARAPDAPRRKAVYLVASDDRQMALRVPANSPCVAVLDSLASHSA